jgi:hypothetical protein
LWLLLYQPYNEKNAKNKKEIAMAESNNIFVLPVVDTVRAAWDKVYGSKGTFWAAIAISVVIGAVLGFFEGLVSNTPAFIQFLVSAITSLVQFLLQIGILYIGIIRAKDGIINYKLLFYAFEMMMAVKLIALYILQIIIFIPMVALAAGAIVLIGTAPLISALFLVVAAVAAIYVGLRLMLTMAFVVDKNLGPIEAIKASFRASRENIWSLLGIAVIQFLILFISAIPIIIGTMGFMVNGGLGAAGLVLGIAISLAVFVWTIPWGVIVYGLVYKKLAINA